MRWFVKRNKINVGIYSSDSFLEAMECEEVHLTDRVAASPNGPWRSAKSLQLDLLSTNPRRSVFGDGDLKGLNSEELEPKPTLPSFQEILSLDDNSRIKFIATGAAVLLVLLGGYVVASRGCSAGVRRYRLQGTVTYNGSVVPQGTIGFQSDEGGRRYSGYDGIVDGKFDTNKDGKGHIGGPHSITVTGFRHSASESFVGDSSPELLFEPIEWNETLRRENTRLDIQLP
jgi:hypothetical protein